MPCLSVHKLLYWRINSTFTFTLSTVFMTFQPSVRHPLIPSKRMVLDFLVPSYGTVTRSPWSFQLPFSVPTPHSLHPSWPGDIRPEHSIHKVGTYQFYKTAKWCPLSSSLYPFWWQRKFYWLLWVSDVKLIISDKHQQWHQDLFLLTVFSEFSIMSA